MKIKYEFATLLFAQKTQKNVSPLRGLTQVILTPKAVSILSHISHDVTSVFNARYFNPEGVALL